jgi:sulfite exporter TauE/SafE
MGSLALELGLPAVSGVLLGVSSMPHCAAMCGPLTAAVCGSQPSTSAPWRYQLGRLVGYGFAGHLAGQAGRVLEPLGSGPWPQRLFLALVVGSTLLVAARLLWPAARDVVPAARLVRRGSGSAGAGAFARLLPREPALLGTLSALLPCGALYAALLLAAATRSAQAGTLLMLGFCATSGFATTLVSALLRRIDPARRRFGARFAALALVLSAGFWLARPLYPAALEPTAVPAAHSCH